MGNLVTNEREVKVKFKSGKHAKTDLVESVSANNTMNQKRSELDVAEGCSAQCTPIGKLCSTLKEKSLKHGINGVTDDVFVNHVFPHQSDLGYRVFKFLHTNSKVSTQYLGCVEFRQQCEHLLSLIDDAKIIEYYIKMYAQLESPDLIDREGVTQLLNTWYTIVMQQSGRKQICQKINHTFDSISTSIFFNNDVLSTGYVCRWFQQNLSRIILTIHKYCLHTLTTSYHGIDQSNKPFIIDVLAPVLEIPNSPHENSEGISPTETTSTLLMQLSQAWLLAAALPSLYSKPQKLLESNNKNSTIEINKNKQKCCQWTLLYSSNAHGLGVNRFLHHVLGYRGPTLVLILNENEQMYVVAASSEWKENTNYTGGTGSCVMQLLPKFSILEQKPNILYLNTYMRGYAKGLRAGSDPKNPIISIDEHFEKVDINGICSNLRSIEVWGCGDEVSREVQLNIKKWQVKEAERQRTIKLTAAEWVDHPDRFLLQLGGRQTYN